MRAEEWVYINNKSLDGYLQLFPQTGSNEDERKYAEEWIAKLYQQGDFKLMDGSEYKVVEGRLELKRGGENAEPLINRELKNPKRW